MSRLWDMALQCTLHRPGPAAAAAAFTLQVQLHSSAPRLVLWGPSGAGKSMTLQLWAGLQRPDHGHIRFAGQTWCDTATRQWRSPAARRAGHVFQDYALFPHLTVAQNVAFGLTAGWRTPSTQAAAGMPSVRHWLDRLELWPLREAWPEHLSGGQRQRVALARALAPQPQVLLLDEPFAALDSALREQLRAQLDAVLRDVGIPLLLITHDDRDAQALDAELVAVENGRIRHGAG